MMRTKLNSWLRRTVMHGAMDLALQATEVNAYCYDGQDGRRRLNADVADASEAVHTARDLTPAGRTRTSIGRCGTSTRP